MPQNNDTGLSRERVLARLWEIANLSPDMTRNSITGQVKALSLIVAIEGLIPGKMTDRRAGSAEKKPAPPSPKAQIYASAWLNKQPAETAAPEAPEAQQEDGLGIPRPDPAPAPDTRVPFSIPGLRFGQRP